MPQGEEDRIIKESKLSNIRGILPLSSIITILILLLLLYFFFSDGMYRFYGSVLFLFYAVTQKMWVSVVLLGVFQTLLLVPLRIIRVMRADHLDEFHANIQELKDEELQRKQVKQQFSLGNRSFLFYITDFVIQLTTFLTIGKLFLTDFYSIHLPDRYLYSFVPRPEFPIQDTIFKIPYPSVTSTVDLGWKAFLGIWLVLILLQAVAVVIRYLNQRRKQQAPSKQVQQLSKYTFGYLVLSLIFSWVLMRYFPTSFSISIFSGSVALPNRTLNSVTAFATFGTLLWFGMQNILMKSKLARESGIDEKTIDETQKKMFAQSVFDSSVIGIGAYFITNNIPSAFELSIFTFEVISLISPFTLDKVILNLKKHQRKNLAGSKLD